MKTLIKADWKLIEEGRTSYNIAFTLRSWRPLVRRSIYAEVDSADNLLRRFVNAGTLYERVAKSGGDSMKKVIITGANRGLGLELLKLYIDNQHLVFPIVRAEEALNYIMINFPRNCYPILADLTKDESKEIIKTFLGKYTDSIDILINNAGVSGKGYEIDLVETSEINDLFNIHCLGPIRVVQASVSFLRNASNPRVINICSRLGSMAKMASGEFAGRNFSYSYRIAKAAQNMFTICLSQELFDQNISVCTVHPGQLLTRGRSSDANMEPTEAASNIYEYIKTLTIEGTGQFIQPQKGKLPW